jgi:signal peptidase I
MIGSVERYSSSTRRKRTGFFSTLLFRVVMIALLLYIVASHFFVSTSRIESTSMAPTLEPRDRVIVSTLVYGPRVPFTAIRIPGLAEPMRGDLVVIRPPFVDDPPFFRRVFEPIARFFTVQRVTLHRDMYGARVNSSMVKRLVGLPGDTIRLRSYQAFIKPRGATQFVAETELLPAREAGPKPVLPRGWDSTMPLSGTSPDLVLGPDEYYVLGDNRQQSSDSRSWGPIPRSRITARVLYRYWPLHSVGKP